MQKFDDKDLEVLKRHQRALCHLRERNLSDRIALFLGAGVSADFRFPSWPQLIERIEAAPEFASFSKPAHNNSLTYRTQSLINHLQRKEAKSDSQIDAAAERIAKHDWITIVHRCLYENTATDSELQNHPYLGSFLSVIKSSPLTVNYNFDDCIERMLAKEFASDQAAKNERVYETVWDPSTQYQRSQGVIYHPNGFLPKHLVDGYSSEIVFADGEFADQLIQAMHGHYSTLTSHLSRYTSLLIGLSLEDPTLKHLLRQNTQLNPGHVHYWVKRCDELPTVEQMREERDVNFEVYGLVTLHLTESEISTFGRLLACSTSDYAEARDRCGVPERYINYITGAVGAGKTSTVQKLKSLCWLGEWVDSKPEELAKPHVDLTACERLEVDNWISNQFRKKDFKMEGFNGGIIICDRSPLDPLAFSTDAELSKRAQSHLQTMIPGASTRILASGQILFLSATGGELRARARHRHITASVDYLELQQNTLKRLYETPNQGVKEISTCGRTLSQVVRNVAKAIHLAPYSEFNVHDRISDLGKGDPL
jgi:hypothetical protein